MATNFSTKIAITGFVRTIATRQLVMERVWVVSRQNAGIADTLHMVTIFSAFCIWGAHWRHLANTTELSVCGSDAALCQITMTIWLGAAPSGLTSAHLHHPPIFYRPDALPDAEPTVSKHWRQLSVNFKIAIITVQCAHMPAYITLFNCLDSTQQKLCERSIWVVTSNV